MITIINMMMIIISLRPSEIDAPSGVVGMLYSVLRVFKKMGIKTDLSPFEPAVCHMDAINSPHRR